MIYHQQAPSEAVNLSGLVVTEGGGDALTVAGSALLLGVERAASYSGEITEGEAPYLDTEGGVSKTWSEGQSFAHLAWRDAEGLHVIQHTT